MLSERPPPFLFYNDNHHLSLHTHNLSSAPLNLFYQQNTRYLTQQLCAVETGGDLLHHM